MRRVGHYDQQIRFSPTGLGIVIVMHAAALGALALVKGPEFFPPSTPIDIFDVPVPPEPRAEPEREPLPADLRLPAPPALDRPSPEIPTANDNFTTVGDTTPHIPALDDGSGTGVNDVPDLPPPPVRVEAQWDARFAADRQPPYPSSEQRAQRNGNVRIELTIGADGRVKAIRRLSASSDAFWRATERHALARWRFRPATLDGRPIDSRKTMTVWFRIEG